jgi:small subunit ribosomal protein S1
MSDFATLFQESIIGSSVQTGSVITGKVIDITSDYVIVDAGLKSESVIAINQFYDEDHKLEVNIGDDVEVVVVAIENGFGETRLSREKAKRAETWKVLEAAHNNSEIVQGIITGKVRGGFTVDVGFVRAFLPGSLVDVRPIRDTAYLEGKLLDLKVIKIDVKRNNIVVSRRAVIEEENSSDRDSLLNSLEEGQEIKGIVKNLTDYGAFVDLGGIDGLLHITDMAWKRVKHPSDIVTIGDELTVKVLKFDREKNRVSLSLKQLNEDPWLSLIERFPVNSRINGKVTNITDYGCFVEIESGIEGLVHVSEMDWTNKNIHPTKVVQLDDEVEVLVLEIDAERRRISLGIKQCIENPWQAFAEKYSKGDKVKGNIKSMTDFGIFIGLEGNIDGLIHLSDISWDDDAEIQRTFKKGDEMEALILTIDPERERISLGIKQLDEDPFSVYLLAHGKGATVNGAVSAVEEDKVLIDLAEGVVGSLLKSDFGTLTEKDMPELGSTIEAKIIGTDRVTRHINVSVKAKEEEEKARVLKKYTGGEVDASSKSTFGDLLKDKMSQDDDAN